MAVIALGGAGVGGEEIEGGGAVGAVDHDLVFAFEVELEPVEGEAANVFAKDIGLGPGGGEKYLSRRRGK